MDPSGNMLSLHTQPHKTEYVLYLDSSMRQTCCVECPLKIPELEAEGIKFELDALGLMRDMSPKEYDEITKQIEKSLKTYKKVFLVPHPLVLGLLDFYLSSAFSRRLPALLCTK